MTTPVKEKPVRMTLCDGCPCLNVDYEQGSSCNLDYHVDVVWDKDGHCIKASCDCKLKAVTHGAKVHRPKTALAYRENPRGVKLAKSLADDLSGIQAYAYGELAKRVFGKSTLAMMFGNASGIPLATPGDHVVIRQHHVNPKDATT